MSGKQTTQDIRDRLAAYQADQGLTLKELGSRVGKSEAFVSRYLGGDATAVGDVEAFERAVVDMLDNAVRKRRWEEIFFQTEAIKTCYIVFDLIRESSDIGLVTGPAGIGKSTASRKYAAENKTVISFVAEESNGMSWGVVGGICSCLDMRKWQPGKMKRAEFVREKLTGSERLIIVDNAQRLCGSGLRWLFDLHDHTGVSIALVGNPEVLDKLKHSDQLLSRIGFKQDIGEMTGKGSWLDDAADKMVQAMWPASAKEIGLLARETAHKQGHLRTLNKQLRIAIRLVEAEAYRGKIGKAFVDARHLIGADDTQSGG